MLDFSDYEVSPSEIENVEATIPQASNHLPASALEHPEVRYVALNELLPKQDYETLSFGDINRDREDVLPIISSSNESLQGGGTYYEITPCPETFYTNEDTDYVVSPSEMEKLPLQNSSQNLSENVVLPLEIMLLQVNAKGNSSSADFNDNEVSPLEIESDNDYVVSPSEIQQSLNSPQNVIEYVVPHSEANQSVEDEIDSKVKIIDIKFYKELECEIIPCAAVTAAKAPLAAGRVHLKSYTNIRAKTVPVYETIPSLEVSGVKTPIVAGREYDDSVTNIQTRPVESSRSRGGSFINFSLKKREILLVAVSIILLISLAVLLFYFLTKTRGNVINLLSNDIFKDICYILPIAFSPQTKFTLKRNFGITKTHKELFRILQ